MSNFAEETVLSVHHWTDRLFSFRTSRQPSFRFRNGQFTMIGLKDGTKPLVRAYSMASPNYEDYLEFFSIKVQGGPLTSRLQNIKDGDPIVVGQKPTGTLVVDNLLPGKNLYLLSTGTGLAPFLSLIRDIETYEQFERIVLIHGCRFIADLAYCDYLTNTLPEDEIFGELVREKLIYYPTVTREPFHHVGRITHHLQSAEFFSEIGLPPLSAASDRIMLCGSPQMIQDLRGLIEGLGFSEGNHGEPGHFLIEKAFVQR
jgi:ferredoxin--NADP+ reductase